MLDYLSRPFSALVSLFKRTSAETALRNAKRELREIKATLDALSEQVGIQQRLVIEREEERDEALQHLAEERGRLEVKAVELETLAEAFNALRERVGELNALCAAGRETTLRDAVRGD